MKTYQTTLLAILILVTLLIYSYSVLGFQKAHAADQNMNTCAEGLDGERCAPPLQVLSTSTQPSITSNVLFIPGTLTSRLYMKNPDGSERELWEPRSNLDIGPLAMNSYDTSVNEIYTRDIVDRLYSNDPLYGAAISAELKEGAETYGPFEKFMDSLVSSGTIHEWKAFPYDWRYDVLDIVKDGTLVGTATSSPIRVHIQDVVQELASTSPTGRVTIVAHSNGGLIAKALAMDLQSKNESDLIDKIILVGTPQFGTPKSITDLLHGDEFTQLGGLLMYSNTVRDTEKTMPGAYDLLPSPSYFENIPTPVTTFDSNKPADLYQKTIDATISTFSQLSDFVTDAFHLDDRAGLPGSPKTPIAVSSELVQKAEATHSALDSWTPPDGITVIAISGWGQLTPYQTNYTGTTGLTCDRTNFFVPIACSLLPQIKPVDAYTENGDDTVVAASARGLTANALFFNAAKYDDQEGEMIVHKNLLSAPPLQDVLKEILTASSTPDVSNLASFDYFSSAMPDSFPSSYTIVSAHSPVNLLATDSQGRQTGIVGVNGLSGMYFEKEEIPGGSIHVVDDEKYLYLPSGLPYTVTLQGYDIGTTTIDIESFTAEGTTTLLDEFKDIPTTASTTATFSIAANGRATLTSSLPTSTPPMTTSGAPALQQSRNDSGKVSTQTPTSLASSSISSITDTWIHSIKNVSLSGFTAKEILNVFFTITSSGNITTLVTKVFISILPLPH